MKKSNHLSPHSIGKAETVKRKQDLSAGVNALKKVFCLAAVLIAATACGGRNKAKVETGDPSTDPSTRAEMSYPVEIDISKNYPKKTVVLQDVAEVTYIPFETSGNVLMDSRSEQSPCVSDSLVVTHNKQGDVFLMGRDGRLVSKFNRKGRGPGEYSLISQLAVDFDRKEVYIYPYQLDFKIMVYSFLGEYKREFGVPAGMWLQEMTIGDRNNLLTWSTLSPSTRETKKPPFQIYYLISKDTGEFKPIPIEVSEFKDGTVVRNEGNMFYGGGYGAYPIAGNGDRFILSDYACDTIYSFKGGELSPFIVPVDKKPDEDVGVVFSTTRYTVSSVGEHDKEEFGEYTQKFICIDHGSGEVFEPEFINGDSGEPVSPARFSSNRKILPAEHIATGIPALELTDARDAGKLKGRLAEIAATLKEDDNPVLMLVKFKQ